MTAPVRKLGIPQKIGNTWAFVNPTGDPYAEQFGNVYEIEYAEKFLIPYLRGEDKKVFWKMVPPAAKIFIFFILRIQSLKHADISLSTVILPNGCALLFDGDAIVGYNDGLSDKVFMRNNKSDDNTVWNCTVSSDWDYMFHKVIKTRSYYDDYVSDDYCIPVWERILAELFRFRTYAPMSDALCSRLTFELRIRKSAERVSSRHTVESVKLEKMA